MGKTYTPVGRGLVDIEPLGQMSRIRTVGRRGSAHWRLLLGVCIGISSISQTRGVPVLAEFPWQKQVTGPMISTDLPSVGTAIHVDKVPAGMGPILFFEPVTDEEAKTPAIDYPLSLTPQARMPSSAGAPDPSSSAAPEAALPWYEAQSPSSAHSPEAMAEAEPFATEPAGLPQPTDTDTDTPEEPLSGEGSGEAQPGGSSGTRVARESGEAASSQLPMTDASGDGDPAASPAASLQLPLTEAVGDGEEINTGASSAPAALTSKEQGVGLAMSEVTGSNSSLSINQTASLLPQADALQVKALERKASAQASIRLPYLTKPLEEFDTDVDANGDAGPHNASKTAHHVRRSSKKSGALGKGSTQSAASSGRGGAEGREQSAASSGEGMKEGRPSSWRGASPLGPSPADGQPQKGFGFLCGLPFMPTCCGNGVCDADEDCSTCPQDCTKDDGSPCPRVGILFSGWHWPASFAVDLTTTNLGKTFVNVEQVIRSRTEPPPAKQNVLDDVYAANKMEAVAIGLYWMHQPMGGYSCLVHARNPYDINYNPEHERSFASGSYIFRNVSDCSHYKAVARHHATLLTDAGIDYVVLDMTNQPTYNWLTDGMALRPLEVLAEEWASMRLAGERTPDIAPWVRLPIRKRGGAYKQQGTQPYMYPYILRVMNHAQYDRVFLRDPRTAKKMFFYADLSEFDVEYLQDIAGNGGRGDILPVPMWVSWYTHTKGAWFFMAPCGNHTGGTPFPGTPCRQPYVPVTAATGGSMVAVSPSYQQGYASWPWGASGQLEGYMLRAQFQRAFEVQPDFVFISGWNEHAAQPFSVPKLDPAMGLETDPTLGHRQFVDIYGSAYSRDIEPTVEGGSLLYDTLTSCLRVFRTGSLTCDNPDEPCCMNMAFGDTWAYAGSAQYGGVFGIYSLRSKDLQTALMPQTPLYSCAPECGAVFNTSDSCGSTSGGACGGKLVGYLSAKKAGDFLRTLRLCANGTLASSMYSLVGSCSARGLSDGRVLGFVR